VGLWVVAGLCAVVGLWVVTGLCAVCGLELELTGADLWAVVGLWVVAGLCAVTGLWVVACLWLVTGLWVVAGLWTVAGLWVVTGLRAVWAEVVACLFVVDEALLLTVDWFWSLTVRLVEFDWTAFERCVEEDLRMASEEDAL
jgi:hypothetical protein